ncbi:unnamed protein product [Dimorphilus gyrociliatus]|uniref:Uncharacterized protein n=1 Tax=Dimorphilus gyrociliatus TaxID=2664684 RepID=A0A7I8V9R8_9ANNE|nr:unnamed protein product [Dimorphilus gyrociliatus]
MLAFREDYNDKEWPDNFINNWRKPDEENHSNLLHLHEFVKGLTIKGKYLEIGSGPSPIGIFSASTKFDDITLSDFSVANIDRLKKWKSGGNLSNIMTLIEYVAKLEGRDVNQLMTISLSRVKNIRHADLLNDEILPKDDNKYSAISMNFVLLCACKTKEDLFKAFTKLYNKLTPGGRLFDFGALNTNNYNVGGRLFSHCEIDLETLVVLAERAGFKVLKQEKLNMNTPCYCIVASR